MKSKLYLGFVFAIVMATSSFAAEPPTIRDRVATFLETKVIGKSQLVDTKGTVVSDEKRELVEFKATVTYSNLTKTAEGLTFEVKRDIKQTNTPVDENDNPTGDPVTLDREVVLLYALGERVVTKSLVGIAVMTKNTMHDSTGIGFTTMIEISDNDAELYIYDAMAGFMETSLDGKNIHPTSTASDATLTVNAEGKLQTDETIKFYKVDINKDFAREELNRFNLTATEAK